MASMAQLIGRRPRKFTAGQGVGVLMQGAGKYFGDLAIEKRNSEALQESRNYQEGRVSEQRDYNEGVMAEQRAYDESIRDEQRDYNESQATDALAQGAITDSITVDGDDIPHIVRMDTNGNVVEDLGRDPDYGFNEDGTVGRKSVGKGGGSEKRTESQIKYGIHQRNLNNGIRMIEGVLGNGYDLESFDAFQDQVLGKFGTWGNWATSTQGRQYRAGVVRAAEALFKGESGAAGSDAESARYQSMFPAPGDDPTTIELKFMLLEQSKLAFEEASGLSRDDQTAYTRSIADELALNNGFMITDDGFSPVGTHSGAEGGPEADQDLFDKYNIK